MNLNVNVKHPRVSTGQRWATWKT